VIIEDHEATLESKSVIVDSNTASNKIEFKPLDAGGAPIPFANLHGATAMLGPTTITMYFGVLEDFHFSNTKKYKMYNRVFYIPENTEKLYEIALSTGEEIASSKVISNDPNRFTPMTVTNPSIPAGQQQDFHFHVKCSGFTTWNTLPIKVPNPANIQVFEDDFDNTYSFYRFLPAAGSSGFAWETTLRQIHPERGIEFIEFWETPLVTVGHGAFDFKLGQSLVNFTGTMWNSFDGRATLQEYGPKGFFSHSYAERVAGSVTWALRKNDEVVSSGFFLNPLMEEFQTSPFDEALAKGPYKLTLNWDSYYVGGRFSTVTTDLDFSTDDNSRYDYVPPVITEFVLTSDNHATNTLEAGKGGTIAIKMSDSYTPSTTLEIKPFNTNTWTQVPLSISDDKRVGIIQTDIPSGLYSLRLKSVDLDDNAITQTLDPAFAVGSQPVTMPFTKVTLILPLNFDINTGVDPDFTWSTITDANYTFQLSKSLEFDEFIANEVVTAAAFSLPAPLETDATYYWRVKAKVADVELPWSKVFTFKASSLQGPVLKSPTMNAIDVSLTPNFSWVPVNNEWQTLVLSLNEDFSMVSHEVFVGPGIGEYGIYNLMEGTKYHWRVMARYYTYYHSYNIPSESFSFTTKAPVVIDPEPNDPTDPNGPDVVTGLEDSPNVLHSFPNPFSDRAYIRVSAKGSDVARMSLFDNLGRRVRTSEHNLVKGENLLIVESEPSDHADSPLGQGLYIALIETGTQKVYRVKLMKK
jgi:hypothetical protein